MDHLHSRDAFNQPIPNKKSGALPKQDVNDLMSLADLPLKLVLRHPTRPLDLVATALKSPDTLIRVTRSIVPTMEPSLPPPSFSASQATLGGYDTIDPATSAAASMMPTSIVYTTKVSHNTSPNTTPSASVFSIATSEGVPPIMSFFTPLTGTPLVGGGVPSPMTSLAISLLPPVSASKTLHSDGNSNSKPTVTSPNVLRATDTANPHAGALAGLSIGILVAISCLVVFGWCCFCRHRAPHRTSKSSAFHALVSHKSGKGKCKSNGGGATSTSVSRYLNDDPARLGEFMKESRDWDGTSLTKASMKSLGEPGPGFDGAEVIPVRPGPAFFQNTENRLCCSGDAVDIRRARQLSDPFITPAGTSPAESSLFMPMLSSFNDCFAHRTEIIRAGKDVGVTQSSAALRAGKESKHNSTHSTISTSTLDTIKSLKHGSAEVVYIGKARTEDMHEARRHSFLPKVVDVSLVDTYVRARSPSPGNSTSSSVERAFITGDSAKLAKHYDVNRWEHSGRNGCDSIGKRAKTPPSIRNIAMSDSISHGRQENEM